jgi:hypothetical protein
LNSAKEHTNYKSCCAASLRLQDNQCQQLIAQSAATPAAAHAITTSNKAGAFNKTR